MSSARRFSSHADSIRSVIRSQSAFSAFIFSLIAFTLSAVSTPAELSGSSHTLLGIISGLSDQIMPPRSLSVLSMNLLPLSESLSLSALQNFEETTLPSKPITNSSSDLSTSSLIKSTTEGTPSSPIFMSSMPLPSSCFAACRKYLPSVHSHAPSSVTSSSPADPVNPLRKARILKNAFTYSEP